MSALELTGAPVAASAPSPGTDAGRDLSAVERALAELLPGKAVPIRLSLVALLAEGHVLIEDPPGLGKTTLARGLATILGLGSRRVQFTSDLLPSDVTGVSVYDPGIQAFHFREGPVFTNVLLADEINRSGPRTQSALLEAMGEGTVSVDGHTRTLPAPFMVVATQNPIEHHGTHPLPDSELDRFLLRIRLGYPSRDDEKRMIADRRVEDPMDRLSPVLDADRVCRARAQVRQVEIPDAILESILSVVDATRHHPAVEQGVSPRGSLMLCRAAQAAAFLRGGRCVDGHDVGALLGPVLGHRIVLGPSAGARGAEDVLREIAARHPIP